MHAISGFALLVHNAPILLQRAQLVTQRCQAQLQQLESAIRQYVHPHLAAGRQPVRIGSAMAALSALLQPQPPQQIPQQQLPALNKCAPFLEVAGRMLVISGFVHHAPSARTLPHLPLQAQQVVTQIQQVVTQIRPHLQHRPVSATQHCAGPCKVVGMLLVQIGIAMAVHSVPTPHQRAPQQ